MQDQPLTSMPVTKAPTLLLVISTIVILFAILTSLPLIGMLLLGGSILLGGITGTTFGLFIAVIFPLAMNVLFIVVALGLRRLKKWALYTYAVLSVISIAMTLYSQVQGTAAHLLSVAIPVIVLGYLWSIRKQFVY